MEHEVTNSTMVDRPTQSLPDIPLEILQQIATEIDVPSALNLARTCKALRDAGECRVWEMVDITSGWDPESDEAYSANPPTIERYRARMSVVEARLTTITKAIETYPFRLECIKGIRIEPSDGFGKGDIRPRVNAFINILKVVEPYIKSLDILPLPANTQWGINDYPDRFHSRFIDDLEDSKLTFPKVTRVRYGCANAAFDFNMGQAAASPWIVHIKSMEELEFCAADPEGFDEIEFQPAAITQPLKLLNLKRLTFNHMGSESEDELSGHAVLASLICLAPNLEFLRIKGIWAPRKDDQAFIQLAELKHLKTVVLVHGDDAVGVAEVGLGFEGGIEFARFSKAKMIFEEAAIENLGWDETNELRLENLRLPRAENLQRLTILTPPRLSLKEYESLSIGKPISKTSHISSFFLRSIPRNPTLQTILFHFLEEPFPSTYLPKTAEPEYFVSPTRWEEEGHRGAIIRSYTNGTPGEELWHIRALSRALEHPSGMSYVGARRQWQDLTHYKGRTVPRHILEQAYTASEVRMDWLHGGRDLELGHGGDSGWKILREWREGAGDESEVDDDFTDDEIMDSQDDTDEDDDDDDVSDGGWGAAQDIADDMGAYDDDGWADTDDEGEDDDDDPLSFI